MRDDADDLRPRLSEALERAVRAQLAEEPDPAAFLSRLDAELSKVLVSEQASGGDQVGQLVLRATLAAVRSEVIGRLSEEVAPR